MSLQLRSLLLAALFAASLPAAAQPVKVQLPKNGPREPREPPAEVAPDEKPGPDRRRMARRGLFQLDFDKVDIDKLVQTISDMTGRLFILPENIRGKISIVGPEHGKAGVTADEAYAAFLSALDANGLTVYPVGKFLKVVEKRSGKQSNIPTLLDEDAPYTTNEQMVTKMFRLRFVEAEPVRAVVQQLVSRDGDTIAFPPDILIVNDIGLNMHRLEKIIEKLDSSSSTDEIRVVQVMNATATEVVEKLRQIFEDKNKKPGQKAGQANIPGAQGEAAEGTASLSQMIADERTNKIIVVGNQKAYQRIIELLKHLDTPISNEGQVHVYYLENANAEEMANTLASLTQGIANRGPRPAAAPGQPRPPATVADLFSGEIKITADKGTNSMVIIANASDYRSLTRVIEKLDRRRNQVFIEAVIMEVGLDDNSKLGLSTHFGYADKLAENGPLSAGDSLAVLGSQTSPRSFPDGVASLASLGGFLAGLQGPALKVGSFALPSFSVVINALQESNNVNVLSTPHILTSDNEDAEITVGQNVPFQSGYTPPSFGNLFNQQGAANAAASSLYGFSSFIAPIQRQNVELKLKIKPQINESDYIRLVIDEQTEEIASVSDTLGPTTSKRSAKTTITAKDQQTVVIGGLMQERTVKSATKTPLLGDIPLLGRLFRSTSTKKTKTNLLLFLTPYIVRDQRDFQRIFEAKMKERQEFVEQFYGRQPGYKIDIDYARKAGPLAKMFKSLDAEAQKAENGGPGAPGERVVKPTNEPLEGPPSMRPSREAPAPEAPPAPGSVPPPSATPPPEIAPPQSETAPSEPPPPPPDVQEPPPSPDDGE